MIGKEIAPFADIKPLAVPASMARFSLRNDAKHLASKRRSHESG